MRQYTLNDIKELLTLLNKIDADMYAKGVSNIEISDVENLHILNIVYLTTKGLCNSLSKTSPTENIIPFLYILRKYPEQYDIFLNELLNFCTKVTFTYAYIDINYIKVLYRHTQDIDIIKKAFILQDDFIKDLIETYYHKHFKYDEVNND